MRTEQAETGIARSLVAVLALASGGSVATMYYAQPLLHTLAHAFGVSIATAGLLVTVSQVGYVFGLALLVPLGDLVRRRRLILAACAVIVVGEALQASVSSFSTFGAALFVTAFASCVAQVIVPLASTLAAEHERGAVVGTVMSGLLLGILLARTISGLIAQLAGWRAVFAFGGLGVLALAAVLWRQLPDVPPADEIPYRAALRSVFRLILDEPVLRQRMVIGAAGMGAFSVLWTPLAFLLSGEHGSHYHYGNAVIGLFGLAGVAGALAAQVSGRLADHGRPRLASTGALVAMLVSWALIALGQSSVIALIAGIMLLDLGVQGAQISNQAAIYALRPELRSRLTTAYMVAYFLGGVALSALASIIYAADGWTAISILGATTSLFALLFWALTARRVAA